MSQKLGSPPRVREKLKGSEYDEVMSRITPASAGKTKSNRDLKAKERDHPRECGKNALEKLKSNQNTGSPPRVREKLKQF